MAETNDDNDVVRETLSFLKKVSGNQVGAIILVCLIVVGFSIVSHDLWYFVVSAMAGYLVADIVISLFVSGEKGTVRVPLIGRSDKRGHAFIAYYVGVVVTTFVSAAVASYLISGAEAAFPDAALLIRVVVSVAVSILMFMEFFVRYYERWFSEGQRPHTHVREE
jgi:hypothetical protein